MVNYVTVTNAAGVSTTYILGNAEEGDEKDGGNDSPEWASQYGYTVHQHANQWAVTGGFWLRTSYTKEYPERPEEKELWHIINILNEATEWVDADEHQTGAFDYMHAMRMPGISVPDAMAASDKFVRDQFARAKKLLKEGKRDQAIFAFGVGLHTLQDATSPAHAGFQVWTGHENRLQQFLHVSQEFSYPGVNSNLQKVTNQYYNWFLHSDAPLPKGNLFANIQHD